MKAEVASAVEKAKGAMTSANSRFFAPSAKQNPTVAISRYRGVCMSEYRMSEDTVCRRTPYVGGHRMSEDKVERAELRSNGCKQVGNGARIITRTEALRNGVWVFETR
ncbi:MAG: hypothetical protein KDA83_13395, partial [Planctomycetales bacterium]|nr:hypothetical protein [Planctomycetales bacterium]